MTRKKTVDNRSKAARQAASDGETRARDDHHDSLRLWLRLISCSTLIQNHIRQRLHSTFSTTLPRFDLMAQLDRCPEGLKMGELSQRMMVTSGNVTGITDLLEREDLVERTTDAADRRALRVKLTGAGRRVFKKMAAQHEHWIGDLFGGLRPKRKAELAELLGELKGHVRKKTGN